ncbi:MAG: hypothetical protein JXQ26_02420 [Tissierellales bacterium]|nr:hypothetical protein [Tissierellales bacterium]MBN2826811.1 hypothetical protein [Tissierellales bacterium]
MKFDRVLSIQNIIVPEMSELILKRYGILRTIKSMQPVGRRALSANMSISERVLRSETDRLREFGLIYSDASGMKLSQLGEEILLKTEELIYQIKGLKEMENQIKEKLGLKCVAIVEGDYEASEIVRKDLGRKASKIIQQYLEDDIKIGIMGGTTMAHVANAMGDSKSKKNIMVIPGRGGLGEKLEIQANSVAAKLAHKLGAEYKLLHVPDNVNPNVMEVLKTNPQIKSVLDAIKKIDILVFGIGTALDMANRRGLSEIMKDELKIKNAEAEALGYYFDKNGRSVMHSDSVGIDLDDLTRIKQVICAVAGRHKALAITAFSRYYHDYTLITDEETAKEILKIN